MARHLDLIGIGPGNPDWITLAAVKAIQSLDVLFVVLKEREVDDLVEFRREVLRRHRPDAEDPSAPHPLRLVELQDPPRPWQSTPDYPKAVATWRAQRLGQWTQAVEGALEDGQRGGFLVWGDPSLFESTLAIVNRLIAEVDSRGGVPIELNVIPGISSSLSLATRHQIALNRQGRA
ncbi:MAG: SAM-dependent methyltransferase, partial [Cutibacterium granulosum]|nr:SAM-dependent methyltransferase [Cutibacterium granulosum]